MCGLLRLLYLMTTRRCHCIHTMGEKMEEMEFKNGSVNFYSGAEKGANTFTSTARGGFTIFTLGNPAQEDCTEAALLAMDTCANKVSDWISKRRCPVGDIKLLFLTGSTSSFVPFFSFCFCKEIKCEIHSDTLIH